jgi:hypothetical protein
MRCKSLLLAAGAVCISTLAVTPSAGAVDVDPKEWGAVVTIDGQSSAIPVVETEKGFTLPETWTVRAEGATVEIRQLSADFDPVMVLAIGVIDLGAPSVFDVFLFGPLVPALSGQIESTLSIVGGLTDGTVPADGSSIGLGVLPQTAQGTIENVGVIDVGPALGFAAEPDRAFSYGGYSTTAITDCNLFGGTCDSFDLHISFTGAGGGDGYALTAVHEVQAVPEPSTLALLGLVGAITLIRRRKA